MQFIFLCDNSTNIALNYYFALALALALAVKIKLAKARAKVDKLTLNSKLYTVN